jgi:hypothetical protein
VVAVEAAVEEAAEEEEEEEEDGGSEVKSETFVLVARMLRTLSSLLSNAAPRPLASSAFCTLAGSPNDSLQARLTRMMTSFSLIAF